ncbi:MAG: response regulator transcription factor [Chloroflexi bacterium]|nr:response regulator transcription factor [Chloroflexota bacterium]
MIQSPNSTCRDAKVRVMLCHKFAVARTGLRAIIDAERDMFVVGETDDLESGLPALNELKPDVIITDLCSGRLAALDAIRAVKNAVPMVRVLVRAYQPNGEYFPLVMRAGADGYLTRDARGSEITNAIRTVHGGQNYLDFSTVTRFVATFVAGSGKRGFDEQYDGLSEREREILSLVATDHTNSEIADVLHLSKQTVHNIRARLMEKLGFHDRLQLVKYAIRRQIVGLEEV